jgi:hypothetical protein
MFSEIFTGINAFSQAKKQKREANKINPVDVTYQESPYAKEQLSTARNFLNSRMPGANSMQQGIANNQANSFLNLTRAAGSPQQLMAAAGALQGNTNSALDNLAIQESQYKASMLGNFNNALSTMTNEGDKVYGDQLRKYNRDYEMKQSLLNSSAQNKQAGFKGIGGFLDEGANLAMNLIAPGSGKLLSKKAINMSRAHVPTNAGSYSNSSLGGFNPFATSGGISDYRP